MVVDYTMFKTLKWISPRGKECQTVLHESKVQPVIETLQNKGLSFEIS